jgi:dATP pyrophosphohydrolase
MATATYKRPESVLVVVYTRAGTTLLLQRADDPGFWQSVTGSLRWEEANPREAAVRELAEETGITVEPGDLEDLGLCFRYPILPRWRPRYAPDVRENTEYAFAARLPAECPVRLDPAEHRASRWLGLDEAAARASSWTNREALLAVARRLRVTARGRDT